MNKVYIIFPLIVVLIFGGFYLVFNRNYEARLEAVRAKARAEHEVRAKAEIVAREKAIQDAIEASKRRELDRKEKERLEEARKTARQDAEDRRLQARDDRNKFRDQVSRLKKELDDVKATFAKIDEERKRHVEEQAFLKTYVKQAEANVKYYYDMLDKIAAAEAARAAAEAAAAAAAKKS
jgi:hypothetical protein